MASAYLFPLGRRSSDDDYEEKLSDLLSPEASRFFKVALGSRLGRRSSDAYYDEDLSDVSSPAASSFYKDFSVKEKADGVHVTVAMPGMAKEDVKVTLEKDMLRIKGEVPTKADGNEKRKGKGKSYSSTFRIVSPQLYKLAEIKAEMKNGLLKVVVPKIPKQEEKSDAIEINVE